jgi:hypothetical protein
MCEMMQLLVSDGFVQLFGLCWCQHVICMRQRWS